MGSDVFSDVGNVQPSLVDAGRRTGGDSERPAEGPRELVDQRVQWTVKGIDASVRQISRLAARKSGMRVSSWVETTLRSAAEDQLASEDRKPEPTQAEIMELLLQQSRRMESLSEDLRILQRGVLQKLVAKP